MATYVLIPGAGASPWHWHLLAVELRERGHDVVAVDLPCDDESAGLSEYADTVVDAIGDRTDLVVVLVRRVHRTARVRPGASGPAGDADGDGPVAGRAAGRVVGQYRSRAGETRAGRA